MHVGPVVVAQGIDLGQLLVARKVNSALDCETDVILVPEQVDLLLIVHDEE